MSGALAASAEKARSAARRSLTVDGGVDGSSGGRGGHQEQGKQEGADHGAPHFEERA